VVVDGLYNVSLVIFGHVCGTQADEVVVVSRVDLLFPFGHFIMGLLQNGDFD